MEFIKVLGDFIEKNGLVGTLLLLFVLDKLKVWQKVKAFLRKDDEHEHRRKDDAENQDSHIHKRFEDDSKLLHEWVTKLTAFLEDEAKENIMLGVMKNDIENMKKNNEKTDENVEKLFNLVSNVKDAMIEMGYGKKK